MEQNPTTTTPELRHIKPSWSKETIEQYLFSLGFRGCYWPAGFRGLGLVWLRAWIRVSKHCQNLVSFIHCCSGLFSVAATGMAVIANMVQSGYLAVGFGRLCCMNTLGFVITKVPSLLSVSIRVGGFRFPWAEASGRGWPFHG